MRTYFDHEKLKVYQLELAFVIRLAFPLGKVKHEEE